MAENTYRQQEVVKKKSPSSSGSIRFNFLKDRKFQLVTGMFLFCFSLYLFIAFISYLFTGRADQSLVEAFDQTGIREAGEEIENWLGIYGALSSYYFIYKWFGLGSFLVPILFFGYGYHLVFRIEILPIKRFLQLSVFIMIWSSIALGYFSINLPEDTFFSMIAGLTGYQIAEILHFLTGWGTIILLVFTLLTFIVYFFRPSKRPISVPEKPTSTDKKTKTSRIPSDPEPLAPISEEQEAIETTPLFDTSDPEAIEKELQKVGIEYTPLTVIEQTLEEKQEYQDFNWEKPTPLTENITPPSSIEPKEIIEKIEPVKITKSEFKNIILDIENEEQLSEEPEEIIEPTPSEQKNSFASSLYDPSLDLSRYQMPLLELLYEPTEEQKIQVSKEELEANKDRIVETLGHYGIGIASIKATIGPTVTLYEIVPDAGVRIAKIKNLEDDIALSLAALGIRIIAPIPGKGTIGIEVPNKKRELVAMRTVLASDKFQKNDKELPIVFGKTVTNEIFAVDLAKMPHLLMAGATGQGKSVGLNVILTSLLYKKHPSQLKFVLVDPKKVELTLFNKIEKHFLAKLPNEEDAIITDTSKVINTLNSLCIEMDNRYNLLKEAACRNIKEYNQKFTERRLNPKNGHQFLPYIVLVIDELADLMMTAGKEVEQPIARLAQLARAIGIHLVVATQRPSVNVITGIIKANFPARLSFRVTSKVDSRTILDAGGAEQLIGMGDMLYSMGSDITRIQCAFIDTPEVESLCDFIAEQPGYDSAYLLPEFISESSGAESDEYDFSERDNMFEEAARIIVLHQQGSTSLLQRRLKLGYNRAGRIIDQLEKAGIVGPFEGSKAREVLIPDEYSLEQHLQNLRNNN